MFQQGVFSVTSQGITTAGGGIVTSGDTQKHSRPANYLTCRIYRARQVICASNLRQGVESMRNSGSCLAPGCCYRLLDAAGPGLAVAGQDQGCSRLRQLGEGGQVLPAVHGRGSGHDARTGPARIRVERHQCVPAEQYVPVPQVEPAVPRPCGRARRPPRAVPAPAGCRTRQEKGSDHQRPAPAVRPPWSYWREQESPGGGPARTQNGTSRAGTGTDGGR
jgi:hypothetical protein